MGLRSSLLETEAALKKLTDSEIEAEIRHCRLRARIVTSTPLRRAFENRIHRLERVQRSRA